MPSIGGSPTWTLDYLANWVRGQFISSSFSGIGNMLRRIWTRLQSSDLGILQWIFFAAAVSTVFTILLRRKR